MSCPTATNMTHTNCSLDNHFTIYVFIADRNLMIIYLTCTRRTGVWWWQVFCDMIVSPQSWKADDGAVVQLFKNSPYSNIKEMCTAQLSYYVVFKNIKCNKETRVVHSVEIDSIHDSGLLLNVAMSVIVIEQIERTRLHIYISRIWNGFSLLISRHWAFR